MSSRSPLASRWWLGYSAAGVAMIAAYLFFPDGVPGTALYSAIGASAVVAIAVGASRLPRRQALAWGAFALGIGLMVVGDTIWDIRDLLGWDTSTPSLADGFYLLGYPAVAVAFVLLLRRADRRGSSSTLVDSTIVTLALASVLWSQYFASVRSSGSASVAEKLTLAAYPAWDLLLVALVMRFVFTRSLRRPWVALLLVAVLLLLGADLLWAVAPDSYTAGDWMDRAWLLSYVLWGAAALHPSAAQQESADSRGEAGRAWHRFALLVVAAGAAPVILTLEFGFGVHLTVVDTALFAAVQILLLVRLGSTHAALAHTRDELTHHNELLSESEARFRSVFENAAAGIAILDRDGVVLDCNAALGLAGASPEELIGRSYLDLVDPDERENSLERFRHALRLGSAAPLVRRFIGRNGEEVWGLVSVSLLPGDAEGRVVVHMQDITERRQMEAELGERNRALEDADRLKDELISVVSHDLRTPLTSIMGYLELALDDESEGELSPDRREFLLVAQRNSRRLYRLVEDLLFLSRAQSGGLMLDLEPVDVDAAVRETLDASLPAAAAGGVDLVYAGGEPGTIMADAHRVAEVVENLVSNAVKFTPAGGRVEVEACLEGDDVSIRVRDTGPGIDERDRERLFDRFFRGAGADGLPGAGLGLSIVKAVVEAHDGTVDVESRAGGGTTFEVRFPRSGPVPAGERARAIA